MDTPNISGAKTTTAPATLAGGWFTTLTEKTKRSNHSWSMIPFTEPTYSVPDGTSRKVGDANIPTIFGLDLDNLGRVGFVQDNPGTPIGRSTNLVRFIRDRTRQVNANPGRNANVFDTRTLETVSILGEELVRYLATGMSLQHMPTQNRLNALAQAVENNDVDYATWMRMTTGMHAEIRFNEWGNGGPINWLATKMAAGLPGIYNVEDFPQQRGIFGRRLKAPVMCLYLVDVEYLAQLASQYMEGIEGLMGFDGRNINNNDGIVSGTGMQIVFAMNIEDASRMVSSDPFGNTVAVYAHNRDTHILCHPMMHHQYAYRLRHIIEGIGQYRPQLQYLGLGHYDNEANRIQRPTLGWSVGQLSYNGQNYRADGNCYIPSDYFPYSMLKRTAKFNHIITQVGSVWMRGMGTYGAGDSGQRVPVGAFAASMPAMVQMLWGEQFGYTTSPTIPNEPFFDPETVAQRVDEFLIQGFGSGILGLDTGAMLQSPLNLLNAIQAIRANAIEAGMDMAEGQMILEPLAVVDLTDGIEGGYTAAYLAGVNLAAGIDMNMIEQATESLFQFGVQQSVENVWAAVKAGIGPLFQVPLTPMSMLHAGGPRPGHVVERLQMNFRPDMAVSGGTAGSKPYFLMPTRLNPGETLLRIPTLLDTRAAAAYSNPNIWLGPRDPTVLTGVDTVHYDGDRPREVTDPDYALESPVIVRDGSAGSYEVNGRPVSLRVLPRPAYHRLGYNLLGLFNTFTHGIESANGNYYLYPHAENSMHFVEGENAGAVIMTGANNVEAIRFGAGDGNVLEANRSEEFLGMNGHIKISARTNYPELGLEPENNIQRVGDANPVGAAGAPMDISGGGGIDLDNGAIAEDDPGDEEVGA